MAITGEQIRMVRGAFRMSVRDFADMTGINKMTVVNLERGAKPHAATLKKIMSALSPLVALVDAVEGGNGPGVILKPGFEKAVRSGDQDTTNDSKPDGALDALGWDWDAEPVEDDEPLPPLDWTDEDRAEQIEHWRSRPEAWAKLHEVSRQCLLRAMGVERL